MSLKVFDIVTASGKYPERYESEEFTPLILSNIQVLKGKVNALLFDLAVKKVKVSSGFRPSDVNAKTKGAAEKSQHTIGKAVDLVDEDKTLKAAIMKAPHLLAKHGLWMEDPGNTPEWCHLDYKTRPDRLIRIFKP